MYVCVSGYQDLGAERPERGADVWGDKSEEEGEEVHKTGLTDETCKLNFSLQVSSVSKP